LFVTTGAAAEHMQPVAELAFLEIADKTVDARNRLARCGRSGETEIVFDAGGARLITDREDEALPPRRIEPVGRRIFVEQLLQPHQIWRQRAGGKRRRQMAKRDGA